MRVPPRHYNAPILRDDQDGDESKSQGRHDEEKKESAASSGGDERADEEQEAEAGTHMDERKVNEICNMFGFGGARSMKSRLLHGRNNRTGKLSLVEMVRVHIHTRTRVSLGCLEQRFWPGVELSVVNDVRYFFPL